MYIRIYAYIPTSWYISIRVSMYIYMHVYYPIYIKFFKQTDRRTGRQDRRKKRRWKGLVQVEKLRAVAHTLKVARHILKAVLVLVVNQGSMCSSGCGPDSAYERVAVRERKKTKTKKKFRFWSNFKMKLRLKGACAILSFTFLKIFGYFLGCVCIFFLLFSFRSSVIRKVRFVKSKCSSISLL